MKFKQFDDIEDHDISDIDISNAQDDLPEPSHLQSYKKVHAPTTKLSSGRKGIKFFGALVTLGVLVLLLLLAVFYFKKDGPATDFQAKPFSSGTPQDNDTTAQKNTGSTGVIEPKVQDKKKSEDHGKKNPDSKKSDKPKGTQIETKKPDIKKDEADKKKPADKKDIPPKTEDTVQSPPPPTKSEEAPKSKPKDDVPRGKDDVYQTFKSYFTGIGVKMTDALPNGTYELHPFKPSAFDLEHGLDYSFSDLCRDTKWHKDLYLSCERMGGGSGLWNAYNEVMTCIRRAIDGGLGFVMPKIIPRNQGNLLNWDAANALPLDYLFNSTTLKDSFAKHCPQFIIKDNDHQFSRVMEFPKLWGPPLNFGSYKNQVNSFMTNNGLTDDNHGEIKLTEQSFIFGWNCRDNGHTINKQFYDFLKITNRNDHLFEPIMSQLPEKFIGFHLRQEYDLYRVSFEGLTGWLLKLLNEHWPDLKTIYVAVGLVEHETKFRNLMEPLGYTVLSKLSLAANVPGLTEKLNALKYDELAVVEQRVLLKSTHFYGVTTSTLSWSTGLMRGDFDMGQCRCEMYEGNLADVEVAY